MPKSVTLSDIGKQLGVSTVTVSKALSGQSGVSEEMREKIKNLAIELGYKKSLPKKSAIEEKGYAIGIIISERYIGKYDSFYFNMYQVINEKALDSNSFALLITISNDDEKTLHVPGILLENKLDGLIFIGNISSDFINLIINKTGLPRVFLDFCDEEGNEDSIISDSYYGAYRMTDYLIKKGHKRIAFVGTILSTSSITDRYLGYTRALMENKITLDESLKIEDRYPGSTEIDDENLLQLPENLPDAFFCNSDLTAGILINKLERLGYNVPKDFSVVGYDNFIYPGLCDIEITTYDVDTKKMALLAWKNIIKKLENPQYHNRTHIVEGELIEKGSVKKI